MSNPEIIANSPVPGTDSPVASLGAAVTTTPAAGTVETWTFNSAPPTALQAAGQWRFVVGSEICIDVTGGGGASRQVQRGAEGSTVATHPLGAGIYHGITAGGLANWMSSNPANLPPSVVLDSSAGPSAGTYPQYTGTGRETTPVTISSGSIEVTDGTHNETGVTEIAFSQTTGTTPPVVSSGGSGIADVETFAAPGNVLAYGADPTGVTNSLTAFHNALAANTAVYVPTGTYDLSGGTVELSGKRLYGDGQTATILKNTSTTNGEMVTITGGALGTLKGVQLLNSGDPTGGSTVLISGTGTTGPISAVLDEVWIRNPYNGVEITNSMSVTADKLNVSFYTGAAMYVHDGPPAVALTNFDFYTTPGTSSTGTGILIENDVEGFVAEKGNIGGGYYSLVTSASSRTRGSCPAFCRFSDVYFDQAACGGNSGGQYGAVVVNFGLNLQFKDCWFAASATGSLAHGCVVTNSGATSFSDCIFAANPQHGCTLNNSGGANPTFTSFVDCFFLGNGSRTSDTYNGLDIEAGVTSFTVLGGGATNTLWAPGTQKYGIQVQAGSSDQYTIFGVQLSGNGTGGISDGGTGSYKLVASNPDGSTPPGTFSVTDGTNTELGVVSLKFPGATVSTTGTGEATVTVASGSIEVTDGTHNETGVTEINFTSGATVSSGGAGIADVAVSGGGSIEVTDGTNTETGVTEIKFTSGATVSSGGAGIADVAVSGGGSGSTVSPYTVAHNWRMQDTSGTSLTDSGAGTANALTISGTYTLDAEEIAFVPVYPHAIELGGTNGKMLSGTQPSSMASLGFMLLWWFKPIAAPAAGVIVLYGGPTTGMSLQHIQDSGANGHLTLNQNGVGGVGSTAANTLKSDSQWNRLGLWIPPTGASANALVFINGAIALTSSAFTPTATTTDVLCVGANITVVGSGYGNYIPQARYSHVKVVAAASSEDAVRIASADFNGELGVIPS